MPGKRPLHRGCRKAGQHLGSLFQPLALWLQTLQPLLRTCCSSTLVLQLLPGRR
jgi:hypothetical protein